MGEHGWSFNTKKELMIKNISIVILFLLADVNCIAMGMSGEATQDLYFVNAYPNGIYIEYIVDMNGFEMRMHLESQETKILITNGIDPNIDNMNAFFKDFSIYDDNMNILRQNIFYEDELSMNSKGLERFYYIHLGKHEDNMTGAFPPPE